MKSFSLLSLHLRLTLCLLVHLPILMAWNTPVFAQQNSQWKGVGVADTSLLGPTLEEARDGAGLGAKWFYNWSPSPDLIQKYPGFVPMIHCDMNLKHFRESLQLDPHRHWLVFNEPDNARQCGISAEIAAERYRKFYAIHQHLLAEVDSDANAKPNLVVGGTIFTPVVNRSAYSKFLAYAKTLKSGSRAYEEAKKVHELCQGQVVDDAKAANANAFWDRFLVAIKDTPIETVHIHPYGTGYFNAAGRMDPAFTYQQCNQWQVKRDQLFADQALATCLGKALEGAYCYFQAHAQTRGKEIWITEAGVLGNTSAFSRLAANPAQLRRNIRDNYLKPLMSWYQRQALSSAAPYPLFTRFAWFSNYSKDEDNPDISHPYSNLLEADGRLTVLGQVWQGLDR